ncbi:MAG: SDR family oxidoreductase [Gemmatimonadota bacterium]|uniref:SDR family oxidoreductase n=1 Tax=Candidatus Palauibacter scopulicola TaxID=3056741 RepID=UPI0023911DDB|nr:SDR family oxidoreductase [Candidatus Palauibacter scopulicola]MDE2661427.1 SDR family oxidoreductase [Candidatus Palauibacter scopulicola]
MTEAVDGAGRDLKGQVAVVTGANSGVGKSAAQLLSRAGADVTMVCRSRERGEPALADVRQAGAAAGADVRLELADLSLQADVRALADRLAARLPAIDILVNNAGVWLHRRQISSEGFEVTFATNHLGHFLLTHQLLEPLAAGRGRIVNVSSEAHRNGDLRRAALDAIVRGDAWKGGFQAYGDTKLANALFTFESERRWGARGITANAVHPGVLRTQIWRKNRSALGLLLNAAKGLMAKPEVGGRAVMQLVEDPARDKVTGRYFKVESEVAATAQAYDEDLARKLWDQSLEWTGIARTDGPG